MGEHYLYKLRELGILILDFEELRVPIIEGVRKGDRKFVGDDFKVPIEVFGLE